MEETLIQNKQEAPELSKSTVFTSFHGVNGTFDVAPFLETLSVAGAKRMGNALDEMMNDLGQYYLEHNGAYCASGLHLFLLRELRNAVLKGSGYYDFNKD